MKSKKAQIYIIAAVIIVIAVLSLAAVTNYSKSKKESQVIYDLSSQIQGESAKVIDFQVYNSEVASDKEKIDEFLKLFAEYALEIEPGMDLVIIQGGISDLEVTAYRSISTNTGTATFDFNSGPIKIKIKGNPTEEKLDVVLIKEESEGSPSQGENNVYIELLGKTYGFNLRENERFIFILIKSEGDETYVA